MINSTGLDGAHHALALLERQHQIEALCNATRKGDMHFVQNRLLEDDVTRQEVEEAVKELERTQNQTIEQQNIGSLLEEWLKAWDEKP